MAAGSRRFWRMAPGVLLVSSLQCSDQSDIGPGRVMTIRMVPDSLVLDVGQTGGVHAFPIDGDSAFVASKHVSWESEAAGVATVNDTGGITGVALGTVNVNARADGVTGTVTVSVRPPELSFSVDTGRFFTIQQAPSPAPIQVQVRTRRFVQLEGLAVGTISYGAGASDWLQASLDQTSTPASLTLTAAAAGLVDGTYLASVTLTSTTPGTPPDSLPVSLLVGAG